jgi:hypothetical protein
MLGGRAFAQASAPVSFRNQVLPILTKAACNSGACHGALAGKGGLKLTLRGYDPEADYAALTRQANGRRVAPRRPEASLLLLKPTMQVAHGGGLRINTDSPDYALLTRWIRAGAPAPKPDDTRLQRLEVTPNAVTLKPGETRQITVRARYTDGRTADVTRWVKFGTSDSAVATVDDNGKVTVAGRGEAAITLWFSNQVAFARIVSPFSEGSGQPVENPTSKIEKPDALIDALIAKKLAELGLPTSPPATDSAFLRRAYLDALGVLPTVAETEAFLADNAPNKRAKLIEALLALPEFVDYWAYKWSDLLLVSSRRLSASAMNSFYQWIRQSVAENKPWDRFAREILTAQGSNLENGAVNYYVLHKEPIDLTETTTQAFLGMSLTCARCHNHPLEKWTQTDYYQMANLFARVRLKNGDQPGEVLALTAAEGDINHPRLSRPLPPRPLDGKPVALTATADRRLALAEWLTAPDNPYFAKALVNRVWRHFMGRGLVEAEDDLRLTNPPSNQELFDALAADFIQHGYDVKRLIRQIMRSDAYQRAAEPTGINAQDDRYYSRFLARRLSAEVILDALSQVTGIPTEFPGYPRGTRALQLPDSQVASFFLSAFGRPERETTCACERQEETNVAQALHLTNGETVNQKLRASGGLLDRLLEMNATDDQALRAIFLTALCREPTEAERARCLTLLREDAEGEGTARPTSDSKEEVAPDRPSQHAKAEAGKRRAALEDLFWAVLTDKEFLFNH